MYLLGSIVTIVRPCKSSETGDSNENDEKYYIPHLPQGRPARASRCSTYNNQCDRSHDRKVHREVEGGGGVEWLATFDICVSGPHDQPWSQYYLVPERLIGTYTSCNTPVKARTKGDNPTPLIIWAVLPVGLEISSPEPVMRRMQNAVRKPHTRSPCLLCCWSTNKTGIISRM